jgi:hypothetical protein
MIGRAILKQLTVEECYFTTVTVTTADLTQDTCIGMLPNGLVHLVGKRLKSEGIVICRVVSVNVDNDQHLSYV